MGVHMLLLKEEQRSQQKQQPLHPIFPRSRCVPPTRPSRTPHPACTPHLLVRTCTTTLSVSSASKCTPLCTTSAICHPRASRHRFPTPPSTLPRPCNRSQRVPSFEVHAIVYDSKRSLRRNALNHSCASSHSLSTPHLPCTLLRPCNLSQRVPSFQVHTVVFDPKWMLLAYVGYLPEVNGIVAVFRGTDSHHWANWLENLRCVGRSIVWGC